MACPIGVKSNSKLLLRFSISPPLSVRNIITIVYLLNDNDIQRLLTNLFKNTTPKGSQSQDPFWDQAAQMLLACIIFSVFASSPPAIDPNAAATSMVWSYIGELAFNMLILVGSVKMADRIVREMMGL